MRMTADNFSDSTWQTIKRSVVSGNLTDTKQIYEEERLNYNAKGGPSEDTVLHLTVEEGKLDIAKYFIGQKADIGSRNIWGNTPLLVAAIYNNVEAAKLFIDNGADTNSVDDAGITPLLRTAIHDHVVLAQLLLKHGADINSKNLVGYTPLWVAANKNHVKIARLFLKHEADVVIPLFRAARDNNIQVVQFFIDLGADVDMQDSDGNTPLLIAAQKNHVEVALLFISHGADVAVPLSYAARENHIKVVNLLAELEVNVDVKNDAGDTPLWIAAQKNHLQIAQVLFNHSDDVGASLFRAVREDRVRIVQFLIELGADTDSKEDNGDTPLWVAAQKNHLKIARILSNHGADVSVTNLSLSSFRAVRESNVKLVQFFIELGAKIDERDDEGDTLLIKAAKFKLVEVLQLLLKEGADISIRDKTNRSALFYIQQYMSRNDIEEVFLISPKEWILSDPAAIIEDFDFRHKDYDDLKVKDTLDNLLVLAVDKLPGLIDDLKLRFVFFKRNLYKYLIKVFLDRGGDDVALLKNIYIALQAKVKCDVKSKKDVLENELDADIHRKFHDRIINIRLLASDPSVPSKLADLKIIAERLYSEYFEQTSHTGISVKMMGLFHDRFPLWVRIKNRLKSCCRCVDCVDSEVYHNCSALGKVATVFCAIGIFFYLMDLYTDLVVGFDDFSTFSHKLGLFEILLVISTLNHENWSSSSSTYATEEELLRIELGTFEIKAEHWNQSRLNWSTNWWARTFYKLFCPYKVSGRQGIANKLKAILYNILTCVQLRPVVDRLVILLHGPTTLRDFYRRQAEHNWLLQSYIILERLPGLLLQFYTFQIAYNIIDIEEVEGACDHYFNYSTLNHTNLFCNNLLLTDDGLVTCNLVFRLISMAIPLCSIPSGIIALENNFRKLEPLNLKMSTTLNAILQGAYILMVPARVFMFVAVMHAFYTNEYAMGYLILRAILELLLNLYSVKDYPAYFKKRSIGKKISTMWRLCLFSFRDVFLISIRDPVAYLSKPSEVSYGSLRKRKNFAVRAMLCVCEGLMGALFIEPGYPCGLHTSYFKYVGWFCFISLVLSISIVVMVSDLLHPLKIRSSSALGNNTRKLLLTGFTSIMIMGGGALTFSINIFKRDILEFVVLGWVICLHIVLIGGLTLFIKKTSTIKETGDYPEEVSTSADVSEGTENAH